MSHPLGMWAGEWRWLARPPWWRPFKRRAFDREIRENGIGCFCARFEAYPAAPEHPAEPLVLLYRRSGGWWYRLKRFVLRGGLGPCPALSNLEPVDPKAPAEPCEFSPETYDPRVGRSFEVCADEIEPLPPGFDDAVKTAAKNFDAGYLEFVADGLAPKSSSAE